jgi:hypothetical protein
MRRWVLGSIFGAIAVFGPLSAPAEQYNVVASAGNDGDSHGGDNSDPDAFATFQRNEGGGAEFYTASADASVAAVSASASHTDPLPPAAISTSAAASIEETIHFDELPADSVTIRAGLDVTVTATRLAGFANAAGSIHVGSCSAGVGFNAVNGPTESSNCPGSGPGTIEMVLTRDQILAMNGELDIEVHVSATLEAQGGLNASASANGALPLLIARGAEPPPGRAYLELDPPLQISYTGSQTFFPVPEPGAPLLAAAGAATLAACRRRRNAASPRA